MFAGVKDKQDMMAEGIEERSYLLLVILKLIFQITDLIHFSKLRISWPVNLIWIHPRNGFYLFQVSHLMKKTLNV